MHHLYAPRNCNTGLTGLQYLLRRLHLLQPPKGTTLGPITYKAIKEGPYRKERRANAKALRQGFRIAARRNITMEELISAVQNKTPIPYHKKPKPTRTVTEPVLVFHSRSPA